MVTYSKSRRSLTKAITFRIVVIISDLLVMFFITHRIDLTIGLTVGTNLASSILYFLHERVWSRIRWGRTS